jgi:hypothetical protein
VFVEGHARGESARPSIHEARGLPQVDSRVFFVGREPVDDFAGVVSGIDALIIEQRHAAGASAVETVEGFFEGELAQATVAVVRVGRRERPPGGTELTIEVLEVLRIAIDVRLEAGCELRSGAQQVEFFEFESRGVLAALATERDTGIERPHVLGRDFDVDHAIVERNGTHRRVAQIGCLAQNAGRLLEQAGAIQVAAVKQQLEFDGRIARLGMQAIAEARQRCVLVASLDIEEVARIKMNAPDTRALRLELSVGRQARRAGDVSLRCARLEAGQNAGMGRRNRAQTKGKP